MGITRKERGNSDILHDNGHYASGSNRDGGGFVVCLANGAENTHKLIRQAGES